MPPEPRTTTATATAKFKTAELTGDGSEALDVVRKVHSLSSIL